MNRHKLVYALIAAALVAAASTAAYTLFSTPAPEPASPSGVLQGFQSEVVEPG
ncbi:hypothetical protein [Rhodoferax sp.]|uniref:hypothetical protein n=1 Tax=Rhodoferax sp. TaxID=50421 RepID=UPI002604DDCB|nr:hypothetical protein [Rhodoferax sp.]MDD2917672.1 hypothetical protein [Rhodoferax sp.]